MYVYIKQPIDHLNNIDTSKSLNNFIGNMVFIFYTKKNNLKVSNN